MVPSIISFTEYLMSDECKFETLGDVSVVLHDGVPVVSRTALYAEASIMVDGRRALLCLPLSGYVNSATASFCSALNKLSSSALSEYRLLHDKLEFFDSVGTAYRSDMILHTIPAGESLDRAVTHVATQNLLDALDLLEQEMVKIGFLHGNLKPSNLIYGDDGRLYPIRYHYARLDAPEQEVIAEMDKVREFIESKPTIAPIGEVTTLTDYPTTLPYDEVFPMQDTMRRIRKGKLYGYLDYNNSEAIAPQFTYAENFFENRAVVQTSEGRMGVINHECQWIIEPIYDMLGFEDGIFEARLGNRWIKIDYLGNIIE